MLPLSINTASFLVLELITDDNFLIFSMESLFLLVLNPFCEAAPVRNSTRKKLAILEMPLLVEVIKHAQQSLVVDIPMEFISLKRQ